MPKKPYTLYWWLTMYEQSIARALGAYSVAGDRSDTYTRYRKLSKLIKQRIDKNYTKL